jgi:hypothetical protein
MPEAPKRYRKDCGACEVVVADPAHSSEQKMLRTDLGSCRADAAACTTFEEVGP